MTPYFERDGISIYLGDCRDILPTLAWEPTDIVISDPPYGTGGWRRMVSGAGGDPSGSLVREIWDDGATEWLTLIDCDVVCAFWPAARTRELLAAACVAGLTKHRTLYMRKPDPKPMPAGRTRWSVEPIWVLSRDGFVLFGGDDMYEASTPRLGRDADANEHPYQKPLGLMKWLVAKSDRLRVIDPFMGSGSTLVAAQYLGRRAIGIEIEERYAEIAARRLQQTVLPLNTVTLDDPDGLTFVDGELVGWTT